VTNNKNHKTSQKGGKQKGWLTQQLSEDLEETPRTKQETCEQEGEKQQNRKNV
jgi:hypothetical protein